MGFDKNIPWIHDFTFFPNCDRGYDQIDDESLDYVYIELCLLLMILRIFDVSNLISKESNSFSQNLAKALPSTMGDVRSKFN